MALAVSTLSALSTVFKPLTTSSMSPISPVAEPSRFLLLPLRIRRRIYRYVLLDDIGARVELPLSTKNCFSTPCVSPARSDLEDHNQNVRLWLEIPGCGGVYERPRPTPPSCQIGILLTSRQTYQEVFPILYQERNFHYHLGTFAHESLRMLGSPSHNSRLLNAMKNINTTIFWENASKKHITSFFKIFTLPVPRCNFRIRVIVLKSWTTVKFEQWFIDAIAGLRTFDSVFFCMRYRLTETSYEWGQYSRIMEGARFALGPAVQNDGGLYFRPKNYINERMRAQG